MISLDGVEHRVETVSASAARALHDLLDDDGGEPPADGDELPPLWHWLAFFPRARQRDLGEDGHPASGLLPPMPGLRRMHAGGELDIDAGVRVGEPLERTTTVSDVQVKSGRTGELTFVTTHAVVRSATGRLRERTDLVYRRPAGSTRAGEAEPAGGWDVERTVPVDPTVLFRFSALTYNAHRIHYDRDYAAAEGYPGLVVHGPLQAVLLVRLAGAVAGGPVRRFRYRACAPAYDSADLVLRARRRGPGDIELAAFAAGVRTMSATATR
ncbi:FAS1-like dehydratase domain-containing protein [Asanoa iriomotensis]|uniref:Mesaconyl-C(4)-CoA hydratase n=1 Tax=Asanoa iriomotensis TaxID=234613 RepID=A0ABQ4C0J6_9ACTN|nr:MaoC family dehydratase N-terminal domain-containing protein [Asanoa iriomotensis]GIF55825.1 mesaconyl-C(4)-CoA hydratase [Asanoa iriomotensis]